MSDTYLDGKIRLSSLASPTPEDLEVLSHLSEADREDLALEVLEIGRRSPVTSVSIDDVWKVALAEAGKRSKKQVDAL